MKNYSELLPRSVLQDSNTPLCQHLSEEGGDSCENLAVIECFEHEERQTNGYGGWHSVFYCGKHAKLRFKTPIDEIENLN